MPLERPAADGSSSESSLSGGKKSMETQPATASGSGIVSISPALRQRLQKLFQHAQRCAEKKDFDYANQLYIQCVVEDPANLIYLQSFLANLQNKYDDNKKGARFAGLKLKSNRSALSKAAGQGNWAEAFQAGCAALSLNPWDTHTLLAMASACQELKIDECQLYYLRWALDVDPKDPEVNRQAAAALQGMGQFDQAIACWHRVEQAKPHDEEATQAISRLSVEKTIKKGGYDPGLLTGAEGLTGEQQLAGKQGAETGGNPMSVARMALHREEGDPAENHSGLNESKSPEQRLTAAVENDPAEIANYLQLADIFLHEHRLDAAEQILQRGLQASAGGDLRVRERLEEVILRRAQHQLQIAEQQVADQPSEESKSLVQRMRSQLNQVELEVYAVRADREPGNLRLQCELGLRLKKAGKYREAIPILQAAREDSKRRTQVLVDLGECFQKIEQYKLALSHYEQAVEAAREHTSADQATDAVKLALYRAGVLSTGLRELDRAERHLTALAGIDYGYRDVAKRLDKLNQLRDNT
jgi:tetratricopeptide (TPR) repeat protein